ncbi:FAD-binding oxidoreductase [Flavobacteriaceae bacterium]|nr:FAD-binding oxidoreductase [Flavobacteriaceae bacterium]
MKINFDQLSSVFQGELKSDELYRSIYATDASVYRKKPLAVAFPKSTQDLKELITFAQDQKLSLIPRTAGTSLAGQCVGEGIVVDVSKYFTDILELNTEEQWVRVQPGVIRDDLNRFLAPHGLFFGPNTSTSNRCMIGGMVGNNSSGTTSIKYGVTRDKVLEVKGLLSDASEIHVKELNKEGFSQKLNQKNLEGEIYNYLNNLLSDTEVQQEIKNNYPDASIHRRCTGYALDELLNFEEFGGNKETFNLSNLLSGSEGTLCFSTEIKIHLDRIPPKHKVMVAAQFETVNESLKAVVAAMKHNLYTCELMDKVILDCTKSNREQEKNRFFLQGDPGAILMLELAHENQEVVDELADKLIEELKSKNFGYAHPKLYGNDIQKVHELRKAGLGLLGNIVGDRKAVACIEDTAVKLEHLPNYISEFSNMMEQYKQQAVYYAHAGAGEIHLRPILNLKKSEDVKLFRSITHETAQLVKKYGGSFSGEHGDGIVRAEFIPMMIGEKNYHDLIKVKELFDPNYIFNPGKIVNAYKMDENLRYEVDRVEPEIDTFLDFSDSQGILRVAEKCNGSGDCRKSPEAGGTLCPSYRATKNEKDTTRARANALREFLTGSDQKNRFNHQELYEAFDLCLSCKACSSECPSNVDVANLKAEFLHQYYLENGVPLRTKLFAYNVVLNKLAAIAPALSNPIINSWFTKKMMGVATNRSLPKIMGSKLRSKLKPIKVIKPDLYLFIDEFTDLYDTQIGIDTIELLEGLGYKVGRIKHEESGRSFLSKGLLKPAKKVADKNIEIFKNRVSESIPLIGIEPSAILTFRDEYPRLASDKQAAKDLSKHVFTIEEFISSESSKGKINPEQFTTDQKEIKLHGHCHQKSLSNSVFGFDMLNLPKNYKVNILNTGCCGMAGSFGYEKEHYEISMQVGEDTLFPKLRKLNSSILIAAAGTSCRHQIKDGVSREAQHPVSILKEALL